MYVIRRGRVLQGQARAAFALALQFPKGFALYAVIPFLLPALYEKAGRVLSETKKSPASFLAGTNEGARLNGEGIGEIQLCSFVLGLEDEAALPGIPCSILRSVASAKAVKHIAE